MVRRKLMGLLACALVLAVSTAWAGIPDPAMSYATTEAGSQVSIMVSPGGTGTPINSCYGFGVGPTVDATIEVWVLDAFGSPVYLYPYSDIWLETDIALKAGMVLCPGGSVADQSTDINGYTTFTQAMFAGCCGSGMKVLINGTALSQPPFNMLVNSPDANCDKVVNLTDVVLFAGAYYGAYDYCADFYWDGILNLSDIVVLAQNMGQTCP
jgi:hypothetical protein